MEGKQLSRLWPAVSAGAAALVAVVTLAAYLWPNSKSSGDSGGSASSRTTTSAAAGSPHDATPPMGASPAAAATASQAASVLAQQTLRMSENEGSAIDVGDLPLAVGTNGVASFWVGNGKIYAGISQTTVIAQWSAAGAPTAQGCLNLLRTQPVSSLNNHTGLQFCMEGVFTHRVAGGQVVSYDGTVSQVQVTVWDDELNS